jgi:putative membrane protein
MGRDLVRGFTVYTFFRYSEPPWDNADVPWLVRIGVRWIITILGFVAAEWSVNDVWYDNDRWLTDGWEPVILASLIYVVMRAFFRPILIFLTCPLQLITLGLFIFVVDAMIVLLTEWVCGIFGIGFEVDGFWPAFIGALVVSTVSFAISLLLRRNPVPTP